MATNLEQEYLRELRLGDLITQQVLFAEVSDEKRTALGTGHFLDYTLRVHRPGRRVVGRMRFRILKFRPARSNRGRAVPVAAAETRRTRGRRSRATLPSSGRA